MAQGIGHTMANNAFVRVDDCGRAQQLADSLSPDQLHRTQFVFSFLTLRFYTAGPSGPVPA
jgi:hypothetical protein